MSDKVTHEDIETVVERAPKALIDRLPDSIEKKSALRNLDNAIDYAHQAIEKAEAARPRAET